MSATRLFIVTGTAGAVASTCNITEGRIIGVSDYHHETTSDAGACCNLCAGDSKCKAFTFVSETGTYENMCYLKDNTEDQGPLANRISGIVGGSCSAAEGRVIGSGSYHSETTSDASACCDLCSGDSSCQAFTFVTETGVCYLKDNSEDQGIQDGRVSGIPTGSGPSPPRGYACSGTATYPWCNMSMPVTDRVLALINALTLEEKAAQLQARSSAAMPRLGLPSFCWGQNVIDRVYAAAGHETTRFPIPAAMGSAWNDTAVEAMARVFATEARSLFNTGQPGGGYVCPGSVVSWGPTINLNRDPRWGRNWESPSEDPLLVARYARAFTQGAQQGEDPRYIKLAVTAKHWNAYSVDKIGTTDRYNYDAKVSKKDLEESYFPAFQAAVEAGAAGLMCSYNSVNGVPACFSQELGDVLRDRWGYNGYVTGDTDAISTSNNHHHYASTDAERVKLALQAGTDVESSVHSTNLFATLIPDLVRNGTLDQALVDRAVNRTFMVRFAAGLFDSPDDQPYAQIDATARATDASRQIALDASRQVVTLLKNDHGALPWVKGGKIAVIGPLGSKSGSLPHEWIYPDIAAGIAAVDPSADVTIVAGCKVTGSDSSGLAAAVAAAKDADRVVLALGSDTTVEREFQDRSSIALAGMQEELARQVLAVGRPTAVVLVSMGALAVDSLKEKASAILLNHYTQDGVAAAEVIFGDVNPSGKLPYTAYPGNYTETTDFLNMSMVAGEGRGYRYYRGNALWPFGWGLSYTSFELEIARSSGAGPWAFGVKVTNTGDRRGAEVVQVYVRGPSEGVHGASKRLLDHQKTLLDPSESAVLNFELSETQLATVDAQGSRKLVPGRYDLEFTNGVEQIKQVSIEVDNGLGRFTI